MKPANDEPDPETIALLRAVSSVNFKKAGEILDVGPRHIRRMIEDGKLEKIGAGHWQRITSRSILAQLGVPAEETINSQKRL